jgi:glycine/D-amino acid oxidase-like deaminating enzyme
MAIQEHKRMDKSIIIIGGGLTGLSAGCYGRMNGYRTTIFEMHSLAGGVATAWKRKGYTIDGAMNWLMGTNPQSSLYRIWEELGAAPGWKVHNHEVNAIFEHGLPAGQAARSSGKGEQDPQPAGLQLRPHPLAAGQGRGRGPVRDGLRLLEQAPAGPASLPGGKGAYLRIRAAACPQPLYPATTRSSSSAGRTERGS